MISRNKTNPNTYKYLYVNTIRLAARFDRLFSVNTELNLRYLFAAS